MYILFIILCVPSPILHGCSIAVSSTFILLGGRPPVKWVVCGWLVFETGKYTELFVVFTVCNWNKGKKPHGLSVYGRSECITCRIVMMQTIEENTYKVNKSDQLNYFITTYPFLAILPTKCLISLIFV